MLLRPVQARDFWGRQDETGKVLAERARWLNEGKENYVACLPAGAEAMAEALEFMAGAAGDGGDFLEPDWVVLSGEAGAGYPMVGGAVVFPSSWSLPEKLGKPLAEVHGPVPGLQENLGRSISRFLDRLAVGASWERLNWGLSANGELNHHPRRGLPGLTGEATLETTWLRLERQFLTRLPVSGAILFGIRVTVHRLDELALQPRVASGLAGALSTMTREVAAYKGLTEAGGVLSRMLEQVASGES